jgi:hypothetical protein
MNSLTNSLAHYLGMSVDTAKYHLNQPRINTEFLSKIKTIDSIARVVLTISFICTPLSVLILPSSPLLIPVLLCGLITVDTSYKISIIARCLISLIHQKLEYEKWNNKFEAELVSLSEDLCDIKKGLSSAEDLLQEIKTKLTKKPN